MKRLSFFLALILVLSLLSTAVFSAQGLSVSPLQDATESTLSSDPSDTEEPAEPSEPTEPEDPTEPTGAPLSENGTASHLCQRKQ